MALKGNQKKLDKNNNNRIDAQDFKILKAEKAKGRGKGLQDEKMKPGKPMKAVLGAIALGAAGALGAKKFFKKKKATATPGAKPIRTGILGNLAEEKKKELMGKKMGGKVMKARMGKSTTDEFIKRRKKLAGIKDLATAIKTAPGSIASQAEVKQGTKRLGRFIPKKFKAIGALLGAAGAGAVGQKLIDKMKKKKKKKELEGDLKGSIAPYKMKKKMGGGMMQRPMGYKAGTMIKARGGGMARSKPTKMY